MIVVEVLFWAVPAGALAWTHVLYPLVAEAAGRVGRAPAGPRGAPAAVAVIVAAHDEAT